MKANKESIPNELFDWIETKSFGQLSSKQQELVLLHLTESEYTEMYLAASQANVLNAKAMPKSEAQIKEALFAAFEEKHTPKIGRLTLQWNLPKVAAVFVCLLTSAVLITYYAKPNQVLLGDKVVVYDTVEKQVPKEVLVYDTVRVMELVKQESPKNLKPRQNNIVVDLNEFELSISGIEAIDRPYNQARNQSLISDTLVQKFGFVTL